MPQPNTDCWVIPLHAVRGSYHGKEVVISCDGAGRAGELLVEGIAQVVRWVCRDDQHVPPGRRQLHRQAAGSEQELRQRSFVPEAFIISG